MGGEWGEWGGVGKHGRRVGDRVGESVMSSLAYLEFSFLGPLLLVV